MGPGAVGTGKGQDCGGSCITSKPGIKPGAASVLDFLCGLASARNVQNWPQKCLTILASAEGKGHASSQALQGKNMAAAE